MRTTLFQQIPNITFRQLFILAVLNKENVAWSELRAMNNWNDGALYGALVSLRSKRLITFRRNKNRYQRYWITSEGRAILDQIYEEVYSWKASSSAGNADKPEKPKSERGKICFDTWYGDRVCFKRKRSNPEKPCRHKYNMNNAKCIWCGKEGKPNSKTEAKP